MTKGRRPGESGTRATILKAAQEAFADKGYDATSLRGVARAAEVDPALITHFFGSKAGLFEASLDLPIDPGTLVPLLLAGGRKDLGERIVRTFLGVWDAHPTMQTLLRSAVSHEDSADRLRELVTRTILLPVAQGAGAKDPALAAGLLATQVTGLALTRYVLRIEPVASMSADQLAPLIGPALQRYLR